MTSGLSPAALALLGAAVFLAGVVDSLAGGGGLITLPAYLAAGLDPALVLGTNKLASSAGTVVSVVRYHRALRFPLAPFLPVVSAALAGSWLGARAALLVSPDWIRPLLLAALPAVGWLVLSRRDFGSIDESESLTERDRTRRAAAIAVSIGAYDGFFGPGTGTFFALAFARWLKHDLLAATARAKILNLASNLSALTAFIAAGRLHWRVGLWMTAASVAGHWVGARLGVRGGSAVIRPVTAAVCGGLFLKILHDVLAR